VTDALGIALGSTVESRAPLGGGSINEAQHLRLADGRDVFAKSRAGASAAEFAAEAAGLDWLRSAEAVSVPGILALGGADEPFLALEWIEPGALSADGAERFGRGLAELHGSGAAAHGALPPGSPDRTLRVGALALDSPERDSWADAYAADRLLPAARMASERGDLSPGGFRAVERVCERMEQLAGPAEPPARLHGDLWSGNLLADAAGEAWLVDPAAYGGHREIDLAMLRLFGSPSQRIFDAYDEAAPLAGGHEDRTELWQLFPPLVHAALFGGSYGASAERVAARYA
jgi:fructosamine-3-kinase